MADILIRDMEMPSSCDDCPAFVNKDGGVCQITNSIGGICFEFWKGRMSGCPLVPLPERHGRLVDAREILEKADKAPWFDGDVAELGLLLGSEVTTIVPAEGGQNDVQK